MTTTCKRWSRMLGIAGLMAAGLMAAQPASAAPDAAATRDGQNDFDFEHGAWQVHLSRLVQPLTGSREWVEYTGTSVVRPVWDGRANLGELRVDGPAGGIQGLSLRLYDPAARQWRISWANSRDGQLGPAMIGAFDEHGRGEFYNQESFNGRAIFVRFVFSDVAADSFRLEQAFSDDGGKTWEPNWIAAFSRQPASRDAAPASDGAAR